MTRISVAPRAWGLAGGRGVRTAALNGLAGTACLADRWRPHAAFGRCIGGNGLGVDRREEDGVCKIDHGAAGAVAVASHARTAPPPHRAAPGVRRAARLPIRAPQNAAEASHGPGERQERRTKGMKERSYIQELGRNLGSFDSWEWHLLPTALPALPQCAGRRQSRGACCRTARKGWTPAESAARCHQSCSIRWC